MPLRRLHPSSLPAGRPETTLLPPPLHLPRRTCPSPSAIPARRLRSHRTPRQRRRRSCLATCVADHRWSAPGAVFWSPAGFDDRPGRRGCTCRPVDLGRPTRRLCSRRPEVRCDPAEVGTLAPGQEPHSRRDASVVQQPRANGLRCDLRDEDGDAVGCGPQKSEDPADGVGGRDRLREDQPHNERDEQEPDESPHRPPPFRAGRGER